jgi:diguanylate cyclase (GGDEF)-like protein
MVFCLYAAPLPGRASKTLAPLLEEADKLRSSDPARFQALMDRLNEDHADATREQLEHLQYLNAYALSIRGQYEAAVEKSSALLASTQDIDLKVRASALLTNLHALARSFTEGLRQLERTLALADATTNPDSREHAWGVAALMHNQTGQYALARTYAERVLAQTTSDRARCFAGQSRQEALIQQEDALADDSALDEVIALCTAQREAVVANLARVIKAKRWSAQGKREMAIALLKEFLPEARGTRYPRVISQFEALLAELELSGGDLDAADRHAKAAIEQGTNLDYMQPIVDAYYTRFKIAEARGDIQAALAYFMRHAEADKAYLNEVKARELAYQIVRHETLQQTQQIVLLKQQNELLQLQQQVQQQSTQNSRLVMALLLLLLAFIGLWAYRTKRMQMSLRRMAETDALTEVCNRHHFTRQSEAALAQCARTGEEVALVMFDLDHFKSINDRYGHGVGDWVLKEVVETCRPICRQVDLFGRLGGEEFAILMSGYDLRAAKRMADDCRVRLAGIDTGESGYVFRITASFGATTSHMSGYDLTRLLSHADKALYRAKRGGRNRVCVYEGNVPAQPVLVHAADEAMAPTGDVPDAEAAIDIAAVRKRSTTALP